uniref:Fibrinogen C-terminal domain-containing protein n=1 Tax=Acanthochromis polyacanthus TaxID=80966 RepID=A0A3Q1GX54_9TELE
VQWKKRFQLYNNNKMFARYSSFSIESESSNYSKVEGTITEQLLSVGDSLSNHNGQKFSTFDNDQDSSGGWSCARQFLGGFWYNDCHKTNPNAVCRWGADGTIYAVGVSWHQWKDHDYSLKTISMKIRPVE